MDKKIIIEKAKKLSLLRQILYDFENSYTWQFKNKLERNINKLQSDIFLLRCKEHKT